MRTGLALSAAAGLLLAGAGPAHAAGWTDEKFPDSENFSSYVSTVTSNGEATWALGAEQGSTPHNQESQAFRRGADGWERVPVPSVGDIDMSTMVAPDDVWAAGQLPKVGFGGVVHWDGKKWTKVPVAEPQEGRMQEYEGMTSFAPDNVLIAGKVFDPNSEDSKSSGSVQRWDGKAWNHVELPKLDTRWGLSTIGGTAADDVWALGGTTVNEAPSKGIALHWNGKEWTGVPMPTFDGTNGVEFNDIVAKAPDDVHAVGAVYQDDGTSKQVAVHWDGKEWTQSDIPDTPGSLADLTVAGDQLWAFGSKSVDQYVNEGYGLQYEGGAWKEAEVPEGSHLTSGAGLADGSLLVAGFVDGEQGEQQAHGWRYGD